MIGPVNGSLTIHDWLDLNIEHAIQSSGCQDVVAERYDLDDTEPKQVQGTEGDDYYSHRLPLPNNCLYICNSTLEVYKTSSLNNLAACGLWTTLANNWELCGRLRPDYYQKADCNSVTERLENLSHWQLDYRDTAYTATAKHALTNLMAYLYGAVQEDSSTDFHFVPIGCSELVLFQDGFHSELINYRDIEAIDDITQLIKGSTDAITFCLKSVCAQTHVNPELGGIGVGEVYYVIALLLKFPGLFLVAATKCHFHVIICSLSSS